ncbi:UBA/TS-N domain protein [Aspergillus steynii IBT 23096]|uniref:UBA/TS-N domain protein n=1 Tax=Aspergillus steynii IBT 23096 TaxID=1392250 RepID=A0A2I2FZB6_9EURO|nr:UBA/TS-N domain protein [Aspergillus steynii IBT 23096]PLB45979.1 UBA/TS-N domain protein [Aspergillus steynii IBT 23096]
MDDLSGLNWSAGSSNGPQKPPPMSSGSYFPNVRPANPSGRSTPLSSSSTPSNAPTKAATSDKDSFANLVSFNSSNPNKNVPLIEQQRRLQEERAKKEAENRSRYESQYGGQNSQFWDSFEKGGSGNSGGFGTLPAQQKPQSPDEDDILAAFDASAPVDKSSHFPVPSPSPSPQVGTNSPQLASNGTASAPTAAGGMDFLDDDDPFGLNQLKPKQQAPAAQPAAMNDDDDDFLGLLGKPVSELPPKPPAKSPTPPSVRDSPPPPPSKGSSGMDRAVAELVDMGFPADKSAQALRMTSTGTDIQAAVGLLLTQAHEESRQRSRNRPTADDLHPEHSGQSRDQSARSDRSAPSWMQQERAHTGRSRSNNRSPMSADKDPAQVASVFGNNLLKTANSLWKSGSKKVQQVVNEFNTEQDPNQPKWLRDASMHEEPFPNNRRQPPGESSRPQPAEFTNEALLLESGGDPRASRRPDRSHEARPPPRSDSASFRNQPSPPVGDRRAQQPAFLREQARSESRDPRARVSKTAVEQQSAQAYVSPARRKRPVAPSPAPEPAVDLFESPAPSSIERPKPSSSPAQPSRSSTPAKTLPSRPKVLPPRAVPPLSQEALSSTHRHKDKGAEAYKKGDYGSAHESFSMALNMLPEKHPLTIIIRSNRAMTALKIGEPKVAIGDADNILEVIGPSKGEAESIELGNGEPNKPMKDFFGKALMRKAEALEQLERWADAAQSWRQAVENGYGGSTSIQGRNRCEKAAGISKPAAKPSAPARRPAPAPKKPSALDDLGGSASSGMDSAAVSRLRAANQAAEQADEEKFALTESVDARLAAWKGGKQDNLRALLGSLDTVLWPESGWKKINMSELIMPNKVKVQYMKGIAKVHPDKIPTNATTEQRMISSAVFGTLNEAWDKFKKENNL